MARPQVEIDWKQVGMLLEAGCQGTEIAAQLGIDPETLYNRCKRDNKMGFTEFSQQKRMRGDNLLRAKQFSLAMDGDKTMLVWLGKQRLGQRDNLTVHNEGATEVVLRVVRKVGPDGDANG